MDTAAALGYARSNRSRVVADLARFVSFASVGADSHRARDVSACAEWLALRLRAAGLKDAELVATRGHPIVRGGWRGVPSGPTLLLYGHYDVQPPDPIGAWRTRPFVPTTDDGYMYGRGTSDDKGPLLAHIAALEAYLHTSGRLPVDVECVFEGEEEQGSTHLRDYLSSQPRVHGADVAVLSDTRMRSRDHPSITYALRGSVTAEIELSGPPRDLHSGQFGGAIGNPLEDICRVVAQLRGADGRIAIPGLYAAMRAVLPEERAFMRRTGPSDAEILRDAGVAAGAAECGLTLYEQTTLRPSLTVSGIAAGHTGPGVKGIVPARAVAKVGLRLVADQDPSEVASLLRRRVATLAPAARVRVLSTVRPVVLDLAHPALRAADVACRRAFGTEPAFIRSGGTVPVVPLLADLLGVPTVLLGLALPDDGMHAPNERFLLRNLHRGTEAAIWFLAELADAARRTSVPRAVVRR